MGSKDRQRNADRDRINDARKDTHGGRVSRGRCCGRMPYTKAANDRDSRELARGLGPTGRQERERILMSRYVEVGERIGIVKVLEIQVDGRNRIAKCECDCGTVYEKQTTYLRRHRGLTEVSCGCLLKELNRGKLAEARAKRDMQKLAESGRTLRKRSMTDPTQWEIAERCLDVHNDAGRQPPVRLMEILNEFRKNAGE